LRTYKFTGAFEFKLPSNLIKRTTIPDGKGGLVLSVGFDDGTEFTATISGNGTTVESNREFQVDVIEGKKVFRLSE
jgi:hypothetical protein